MTDNQYQHHLQLGSTLAEYHIEKILGAGGFGVTYLGTDINLGKQFAIKEYLPGEFAVRTGSNTVVPKSESESGDFQWGLERFLDEARTLATFSHQNLNQALRFFKANGTAYMVLEYVEGETLSARLKRDPKLNAPELNQLLKGLLGGLEVVHRAGYTHRDIKPGNIMIKPDGTPVLLDFGAARQALGYKSKSITAILTPGYAPIEQYDTKADDVGPWTDIYSLGMVAYQCVSGCSSKQLIEAVTRGSLHRKGRLDQDLTPAAVIGQGRYAASQLQGIDWAISVHEEERPQSIVEWREQLLALTEQPPKPPEPLKPTMPPEPAKLFDASARLPVEENEKTDHQQPAAGIHAEIDDRYQAILAEGLNTNNVADVELDPPKKAEQRVEPEEPNAIVLEPGTHYLCTCGTSASAPFCDGSHKGTRRKPVKIKARRPQKVYLCDCGKTADAPFCDGCCGTSIAGRL